jgi:uncharacterized membrane protein
MIHLLATGLTAFSPIHFLVGFLILVCVIAIVIIACKWLLSLTGIAIPQPLLLILGIIIFLILLMVLLQYSGLALW